jgi:hypothetical protein
MCAGITTEGIIQLVAFCVFEVMVGLFWPSMMKMRAEFVPEEMRSTIINFFRIPLNLFVCVILYNVRHGVFRELCSQRVLRSHSSVALGGKKCGTRIQVEIFFTVQDQQLLAGFHDRQIYLLFYYRFSRLFLQFPFLMYCTTHSLTRRQSVNLYLLPLQSSCTASPPLLSRWRCSARPQLSRIFILQGLLVNFSSGFFHCVRRSAASPWLPCLRCAPSSWWSHSSARGGCTA